MGFLEPLYKESVRLAVYVSEVSSFGGTSIYYVGKIF